MNNGWIKLHRKFIKWGWYQKSEMVHLFLHFLLLANHEPNEWQGLTIKRGQCVIGRKSLNKATGISEQTIRTCIDHLKSTNEITTQSTNKFTILTIIKYSDYQTKPDKVTTKSTNTLTNNQPTTNQQLTTNKKKKNEKNVKKEIVPTKKPNNDDFFSGGNTYKELLEGFAKASKMTTEQLEPEFKKFYLYWTEPNSTGTKVRWQMQKTFDVKRRLYTWLSNVSKFNNKGGNSKLTICPR